MSMRLRCARKLHIQTFALAILACVTTTITAAPVAAGVVAKIDLNEQQMNVYVDGKLRHSWSIASGREGFETPVGRFRPQRLERQWYSRQYDDAPMPYSVFFKAGYAIHGGNGRMGRPASHGCIRLNTGNAATFFGLVDSHGAGATRIIIEG
jgi:lipoprotein-anchoring transpeptidase ErfK/SrfK